MGISWGRILAVEGGEFVLLAFFCWGECVLMWMFAVK